MSNSAARKDSGNPCLLLRKLRLERKLTLGDVSAATSLPLSTLSKLETGKIALNYDKLVRICGALDVDISRVLSGSDDRAAGQSSGHRSITRSGEGAGIQAANYNYTYPAADLLRKSLVPMIIDVTAGSIDEFEDFMRHPGDEYAYVAAAKGTCRILSICSASERDIKAAIAPFLPAGEASLGK